MGGGAVRLLLAPLRSANCGSRRAATNAAHSAPRWPIRTNEGCSDGGRSCGATGPRRRKGGTRRHCSCAWDASEQLRYARGRGGASPRPLSQIPDPRHTALTLAGDAPARRLRVGGLLRAPRGGWRQPPHLGLGVALRLLRPPSAVLLLSVRRLRPGGDPPSRPRAAARPPHKGHSGRAVPAF